MVNEPLFMVRRYDGWFLVADVGAIDVEMCWSPTIGDKWERWRAEALAAKHHGAVVPAPPATSGAGKEG